MAGSKTSNSAEDEPIFPNLAKAPASASTSIPKLAKAVPSSSTPTPAASMAPPSNLGYDPEATPTGPINPGNTPHTEWKQVSVHTAKCDKCSKHNTSVIQRCTRCNFQLCKNCIGNVGDQIHFADIDSLDWTPTSQPRGARKNNAARKAAPKPAASMASTNIGAYKPVSRASTRNTGERALAQARKQNTVLTDDNTIEVKVPEKLKRRYPSDDEYDEFESKKPRRRYSVDHDYMDNGEDTDEDEMVAQNVKYNQDRRRPRDPAEQRYIDRTRAWQKIEDAALEKSYGKGKSLSESAEFGSSSYQRTLGRPSTPGMASASSPHPSQSGRISGFSFDDAIAQAYEQRQNSQRLAEERRLRQEQEAAWKHNPTIQKLLQDGKVEEAEDMIDTATQMMMARRGMK